MVARVIPVHKVGCSIHLIFSKYAVLNFLKFQKIFAAEHSRNSVTFGHVFNSCYFFFFPKRLSSSNIYEEFSHMFYHFISLCHTKYIRVRVT